ncbi:hypothetical protein BCR42DRAFT_406706 [Absidia repens]|uniref:Uncharacterized protein n=1 Tax=Absidia repens TaxID=90262 RepID=A0A1X2IV81_9FUNG|nr:hypothetical protein BCR42DRAFT_406706 [Absidia repens]
MSNPSRVVDPDTNISLLKPSTWIDTQTTLPVIPATSSSPIIINNNPFSFASTTPTLSLENSRNGFNSANPSFISSSGVQSSHFFSTDQYTSNDVPLDYLPVDCRTAIQQQQKQQRYYRRPYQQQDDEQRYDDRMSRFTTNNDILLQCPDRFVQQNQESNDPVGYVTTTSACSLSPSTSINTIFPPTDDLYNYQGTVVYCGHCQPRDGLHDSSCALLQLFLANIMDDNEDSFSST